MKVAQIADCDLPKYNGVVIVFRKLHAELPKYDVESVIISPYYPDINKETEEGVKRINGTTWKVRGWEGYSQRIANPQELYDELSGVDLIHLHHPPLYDLSRRGPITQILEKPLKRVAVNPICKAAFEYAKEKKIPVILHNHTRYDEYAKAYILPKVYGTFSKVLGTIPAKMARKHNITIATAVACVLAPSYSIKDLLMSWVVRNRLEVVPSSIDFDRFSTGDRKGIRDKYEIRNDEFVVLYVGRIAKEKNVEALIPIADMENIRLMLVGDGPRKRSFERVLRKTNAIFTGQVPYDKIQDYYAAADVVVTASESETQGLFIWEAHAAGKPVVALDAIGVRDSITHNEDGLLYSNGPSGEQKGVEVGIALLKSDKELLAKLSAGARRTTEAREEYDDVSRHVKIYRSLIKKKAAA